MPRASLHKLQLSVKVSLVTGLMSETSDQKTFFYKYDKIFFIDYIILRPSFDSMES